MTDQLKTCLGCAHRATRFKGTKPRAWCKRYHVPAAVRCIDYRSMPRAIDTALDYLKRIAIK